jgi:hypothetical protein
MKDSFENLPSRLITHGEGGGTMAGFTGSSDKMQVGPLWSMKRATIFIVAVAASCWAGVVVAIVALA